MIPALNLRHTLLGIAFLCLSAVVLALVSQYVFDMQPCAWCVLQRLIYLIIAAFAIIGTLMDTLLPTHHAQRTRRATLCICLLLSLAGIAAAWYQHSVAAQMFSCDQTFADRFMTRTGLETALSFLFGIYASCMDAAIRVWGLEYAIWSLIAFTVLALLALLGLIGTSRRAINNTSPG